MIRKPPMTAEEASENVARMKAETSKRSRVQLMRHAVTGLGNLSEEAKEVYRQALAEDGVTA